LQNQITNYSVSMKINKNYKIKEMFYSLQGEGMHCGRPAIFCRFSKCNLWDGREKDRKNAICNFCDTDINGTDGINGGIYNKEDLVAKVISLLPPELNNQDRFIVCTGGEPALQLDSSLISALHDIDFEIAVETNGTLPLPEGIDWICCSPKGKSEVVLKECDELKLVFPQEDAMPERFYNMKAKFFFLTPMAPPNIDDVVYPSEDDITKKTIEYCLMNPKWRLNLQTHKVLEIA
jgi:7-carboxy-7-deazaguanine synthase